MTLAVGFIVLFWGFAAVAIVLGIVISADEYLTEKKYSSSKGEQDGSP